MYNNFVIYKTTQIVAYTLLSKYFSLKHHLKLILRGNKLHPNLHFINILYRIFKLYYQNWKLKKKPASS